MSSSGLAFDGVAPASPLLAGAPVLDYCVFGKELFVLRCDSVILVTNDLEHWRPVGKAPSDACSLAKLQGRLYVGTADSKILESSVLAGKDLP